MKTLAINSRRTSVESYVSEKEDRRVKKKRKRKKRAKGRIVPLNVVRPALFTKQGLNSRRSSMISTTSVQSLRLPSELQGSPENSPKTQKRGSKGSIEHIRVSAANTTSAYTLFTASTFLPNAIQLQDLEDLGSFDLGLDTEVEGQGAKAKARTSKVCSPSPKFLPSSKKRSQQGVGNGEQKISTISDKVCRNNDVLTIELEDYSGELSA